MKLFDDIPTWIDRETWAEFLDVRKKKKAVNSPRALNAVIKKLTEFKECGFDPNDIMEKSIINSWKDVYEPKDAPAGARRIVEPPSIQKLREYKARGIALTPKQEAQLSQQETA